MNTKLTEENVFNSNSEEVKCISEDKKSDYRLKTSENILSKIWKIFFYSKQSEVKKTKPTTAVVSANILPDENTHFDIFTMDIAQKVHAHANSVFYAMQLKTIQSEAEKFGYYFTHAETAADLPTLLQLRLARATEYQRKRYLYPNNPSVWDKWTDESMADGFAEFYLQNIIDALAYQGIRLQEGPEAKHLLAMSTEANSTELNVMSNEPDADSPDFKI